MTIPDSILLCYEGRSDWIKRNPGPSAPEKARWLAPESELKFARYLVESIGASPLLLALDRGTSEISQIIKDHPKLMLWNVSDGLGQFIGSLIPAYAQLSGTPWLGSSVYCQGLCQNKHHWRAVLSAHQIYCLPGEIIRSPSDVARISKTEVLRAPIFVKATSYGNNAGFSIEDPLALSLDSALTKALHLIESGLGPVLLEEYAPGDEYSVWAFEFSNWICRTFIKNFDAPYILTEFKDGLPVDIRYSLSERPDSFIEDLSRQIIDALEISDYVRIEFRRSRSGKIAPIDINTGAFFTGRSFGLAASALGGPQTLFHSLVEASYMRQISEQRSRQD